MRKGVAGIGIYGVDGGFTSGQVVGVAGVDELQIPLRRLGKDALRANLPDHAADVAAEVDGRLHSSIGVAEKAHITHSHHCGGGPLFVLAQRRHLGP